MHLFCNAFCCNLGFWIVSGADCSGWDAQISMLDGILTIEHSWFMHIFGNKLFLKLVSRGSFFRWLIFYGQ